MVSLSEEVLVKGISEAKSLRKPRGFEESVDLVASIEGLDLRKPENRITLTIRLPNPLPKPKKICVIADGPFVEKAREVGVDFILTKQDLESLQGDRRRIKKFASSYDFFLSQPQFMGLVGKVMGFALGPRGKMPSVFTSPDDLISKVTSLKSSVRVMLRKNPEVQCSIGTVSMGDRETAENGMTVLNEVEPRVREKGGRVKRVYVKTTMGPPVRVL